MPRCALSWSGGKDSTLALDRLVRQGVEVAALFTIYEGVSGRVRFHGVPTALIQAQADALGLPLLLDHTHPDDYDAALHRVLDRLRAMGVEAVAFGNIHLADIRAWYEARTVTAGLQHLEPLWGEPPERLFREVVARGYRGWVVSVDLARGDPAWVGAPLDLRLLETLIARPEVDLCGERGEYHSFLFDGPLFRRPVAVRRGETFEREGHRILDLLPG